MLAWLKKRWKDPVWSQVIAAGLVAMAAVLLRALRTQIAGGSPHEAVVVAAGISSALLVSACGSLAFRTRLHTELDVITDGFPHAPWIEIKVRNLSWRKLRIAAVQFQTKQYWDMPDPYRQGVTRPIADCLPRGSPFIKVSADTGSIATRAVGMTVAARGTALMQFRLITDHSPNYGFGLFPFHLGVALVLGNHSRVSVPDVLVSLHGKCPISESELSRPVDPFYDRGDLTNSANQALSVIEQGAQSNMKIIEILRERAAVGQA